MVSMWHERARYSDWWWNKIFQQKAHKFTPNFTSLHRKLMTKVMNEFFMSQWTIKGLNYNLIPWTVNLYPTFTAKKSTEAKSNLLRWWWLQKMKRKKGMENLKKLWSSIDEGRENQTEQKKVVWRLPIMRNYGLFWELSRGFISSKKSWQIG